MTDCTSLASETTTTNVNQNVELVNSLGSYQWLTNNQL